MRQSGLKPKVSAMRSYIGLIRKDADGDFGVSFPDFPGVIAAGTTLDDAHSVAEEALALRVAALTEGGEAMPAPSTLDGIMSDPANQNGIAFMVCVRTEQPKAIRVNVTMPEDVLAELDKYAETHGFTRSRLLTQAARRLLNGAL
jgi:predicted RNase H-like HicB family nuclease